MCNGIWECPGGTDERKIDCPQTTCPGRFRCKNSSVCISINSTCDKERDCPNKDDEHFCSLDYDCPMKCSCLFHSLSCKNITQNIKQKLKPYHSIRFDQVMISSESDYFNEMEKPVIIALQHCKLKSICIQTKVFLYLLTLDVSYNLIEKLEKNCFKYARNVYFLNISRNQLKTIQSHSFKSSPFMKELNLSFNFITQLYDGTFAGLQKLYSLDISGNYIFSTGASVFFNANITNIITQSFAICCLKPAQHTVCPVKPSWPNTCSSLLGDSTVGMFVWFISTLGIAMNISSFFAIWKNALQGAHNYKSLVALLAVSDTVCCISLLIIVAADAIIGDNYLQYEFYWRSNICCYASSTLSLIANFLSVVTINLLALTRYHVAVWPLASRFLENKFLGMICVFGTAINVILGVSLNVYFVLTTEGKQLPTGLCLILGHTKHFTTSMITTIFIIIIQGVSCVTIPVLYLLLILQVDKSKENLKDSVAHKEEGNMTKSILVSFTNLLCWIPSTIMLRLTLTWDDYPYSILIWTTMVIIPLNAILNPFVFIYIKLIRAMFKQDNVIRKIKTSAIRVAQFSVNRRVPAPPIASTAAITANMPPAPLVPKVVIECVD